jgi:hypothetical protein
LLNRYIGGFEDVLFVSRFLKVEWDRKVSATALTTFCFTGDYAPEVFYLFFKVVKK